MKVLLITSEWPSVQIPYRGIYIHSQAESLRKAGIEVDVFAFEGRRMVARYIAAWARFRKVYRISNYDLIHAHYGQSGLLALPKTRPLVTTYHGGDLLGIKDLQGKQTWQGRILQLVGHAIAAVSDHKIVVSKEMLNYLHQPGVSVLPCGINLELFSPIPKETARKAIGLPQDKKLVFFAANPEREVKRYHLASAAVQQVQKTMAGIELIAENKIPPELMPQYMNACDVLLLTSMHEGSPQVVKEAMACNLPIVSVDVGDVSERISEQDGCRVCEDDSPQTIARHLVDVLQGGRRTQGRESIRDLDEKVIAGKLIEIYRQVLDGRK